MFNKIFIVYCMYEEFQNLFQVSFNGFKWLMHFDSKRNQFPNWLLIIYMVSHSLINQKDLDFTLHHTVENNCSQIQRDFCK